MTPQAWFAWLSERFELQRGGSDSNLLSMEGLRGFAVLLVFTVHYTSLSSHWTSSSQAFVTAHLHQIGNAGVDLFFVLSGLLIYGHLVRRRQPLSKYATRRIVRIYPTFLAVLAIYVLLSYAFPSESKLLEGWANLPYLLVNLLLLPGIFPIVPIITVAWSLSYEALFYIVAPMAVFWLGLRERSSSQRRTRLAACTVIIAIGFAWWGGPVRLLGFLCGALLFETLPNKAPRGALGTLGLVVALSSMTVSAPGPMAQAIRTFVLDAGFFMVCWTCLTVPTCLLTKCCTWMPLRWLGNMSYSYYLLHGLTLKAFFLLIARLGLPTAINSSLPPLLLLPALAATLLSSALLFLTVERPLSLKRSITTGP